MFSHRTGWSRELNPVARRLDALKAAGATLFDLTESNPTAVGLGPADDALRAALAHADVGRYLPESRGLLRSRVALSAFLSARGPRVSPEHVVLSASTSEAYAWLFKLLCEPGDDVLVPQPSYPLFEFLTALEAVGAREYPLHYDGEWHLSPEDLAAAATDRTRAVLVVNPGNPTGAFLMRAELEALWSLCEERGWALISDEVFADYAHAGAPGSRVTRAAQDGATALTFSLSGLSKVAALPQLKVGWIIAAGPPALRDEALARLELIADTYLSVNGPAQLALPELLRVVPAVQARIRERVVHNLERLSALRPAEATWDILPVEGGWNAVLRLPGSASEEEVCLALLEDGVVVHPGYFFDFAARRYVVVSLLPTPEVFAEGARRLVRVVSGL